MRSASMVTCSRARRSSALFERRRSTSGPLNFTTTSGFSISGLADSPSVSSYSRSKSASSRMISRKSSIFVPMDSTVYFFSLKWLFPAVFIWLNRDDTYVGRGHGLVKEHLLGDAHDVASQPV